MERLTEYEGWIKAGTITGSIILMESWGKRSVTRHVHDAMEHPIGRWLVPLLVANVGMHLLDRDHAILPEEADIIQWVAKGVNLVRGYDEPRI